MSSKRSSKAEKVDFDKNDAKHVELLKKHLVDWYQKHPNSKFISPLSFQQTYPQFDKYSTKSFSVPFYAIKKKILNGKYMYLNSTSLS